jgi:hypothetical protein
LIFEGVMGDGSTLGENSKKDRRLSLGNPTEL